MCHYCLYFVVRRAAVDQLRRLFQQYLGGSSWGGGAGAMVDRFVSPSASRVVDYVAVMTVKLAPQLKEDCDEMSDLRQVRTVEGLHCSRAGSEYSSRPASLLERVGDDDEYAIGTAADLEEGVLL